MTNSHEDWREFKNFRSTIDKKIKIAKREFLKQKFNDNKNQWKFLKNFQGKNKQHPPNNICQNGKQITSPKDIATIANDFFIDKIEKIRKTFTPSSVDPIDVLNTLIPRNKNEFKIPKITLSATQKIIKKLKNSNSTGHDDINNKIIKKIGNQIAPHIMHMINTIIDKNTIPKIFKISRILPLNKPDKNETLIDSYRPINNLPCLEKIFEEHVLTHLNIFLDDNKILNDNQHGGRKKHSTTSALTQINNQLLKNDENGKISATMTTDLSAAYDTIDIGILLKKLDHYGIRGDSLKLFKSYFEDRKQYVQIDNFNSKIRQSPPCGCVQGSKFSGTMYGLYTNEIPLLYKFMYNDWYEKLTNLKNQKFKNIDHLTVGFVDDSTAIFAFSDPGQIKSFLTNYYNLIKSFYNINKLKINSDKTNLLLTHKPKLKEHFKNFFFMAENDKIKPKKVIKILGTYIKNDLKMDSEIGKLTGQLHNRISTIRTLTKFTDFKTRLKFLNANVIGKLNYALPLYMHASQHLIAKLHKVITTAARAAIGSYCYKKSVSYMLTKCHWLDINAMMQNASLNFLHKVLKFKEPKAIYTLFKNVENRRSVVAITLNYRPKKHILKIFFLYKGLNLYNEMPQGIKNLDQIKFKKQTKIYIKNANISDTMD